MKKLLILFMIFPFVAFGSIDFATLKITPTYDRPVVTLFDGELDMKPNGDYIIYWYWQKDMRTNLAILQSAFIYPIQVFETAMPLKDCFIILDGEDIESMKYTN